MYKVIHLSVALTLSAALLLAGCGTTPTPTPQTTPPPGTATGPAPTATPVPSGEAPLTPTPSQPAQLKWPEPPATSADPTQTVSKAYGLIQNRKAADALGLLEPLAGVKNRDLQLALGVAEYNNGHLDAAAEAYTRAIELDPKYAMAYNNLANVYRDQKKYDLAATQYQLALMANPQYETAVINFALMLESLNRQAWAEHALRGAIHNIPTSAELQVQLGDLLARQKKYTEARTAYEAALKISPGYPSATTGLNQLPKQ